MNQTIFSDTIKHILKTKNKQLIKDISNQPNSLQPFIVCKTISKNDNLLTEEYQNLLSILPSIPLSKETVNLLIAKTTPQITNYYCKNW